MSSEGSDVTHKGCLICLPIKDSKDKWELGKLPVPGGDPGVCPAPFTQGLALGPSFLFQLPVAWESPFPGRAVLKVPSEQAL